MVMLAYASVPLYRIFCQITGFGGTTQEATLEPSRVLDRMVAVDFFADTAPDLPWEFHNITKHLDLKVGERKLAFFEATNTSSHPVTGMATYNVTPHKAGPYFAKIKCFCFDRQTIQPGETIQFPVSFFIDPEIENDPDLEDVSNITLSYTFFRAKETEE